MNRQWRGIGTYLMVLALVCMLLAFFDEQRQNSVSYSLSLIHIFMGITLIQVFFYSPGGRKRQVYVTMHTKRKILSLIHIYARLGRKMLKTYSEVRPLREEEREYLGIRLLYPEKFWKLANYYYNTNKAWIPGKHMEKLEKFLAQREKRVSFSYELLYNNPRKYEKLGR